MTKQLDKATITRLAWITELRRQGHRKCTGMLFKAGGVCALGLLAEVAGMTDTDDYLEIGRAAGLTHFQADDIWKMNDGWEGLMSSVRQHTFAEIADVVDGWFKS